MAKIRPADRNQRVVIFCLTLEVAKSVEPIKRYKPDRIYMLYLTRAKIYQDFKKEVERMLAVEGWRPEAIEVEVWDFAPALKALVAIIRRETAKDNKVFVDVHGPGAWSAAAMVACMMLGAEPYFAKTDELAVSEKVYYHNGVPRGTVKSVLEPETIQTFPAPEPDPDLVLGLREWHELGRARAGGRVKDKEVIERLHALGLIPSIREPGETRISQSATMMYRRGFLEKWVDNRWVRRDGRGRYTLTDYGRVVLEVFG